MTTTAGRRFSLTRHKHSLWALPAFGVLLVVAVWMATWLQLGVIDRALIDAKIGDTENFVASFERYTQRQIKDADRMARLVKREFEERGTLDLPRLAHDVLMEDTRLVVVSAADAAGNIVASSQPSDRINIADREYFRRHKEQDTGLLDISEPLVGRASGRSMIQLTRRMNHADGSFAGVVVLSVTPAYFTDFSKQADPQKQTSLGLLGLDGTFRARVVDGEPTSAPNGRGMQLVARAAANPQGHYEAERLNDHAMRIVAYRRLADYPLIVTAAKSIDEGLEDFHKNRNRFLIIAVAATIAILIFFAVVTTLASRLQRNRSELKVQRLFLKTIVDNVPAGITLASMQPSTFGQYIFWNESNALIFGITPDDALGKTVRDVMTPDYAARITELDSELLASPMVQDTEQVRTLPDGTQRTYRLIRAPIFGAQGQVDYIMTSATDISLLKQTQRDLEQLASFDPLTGLPNRRLLRDRLEHAVHQAQRGSQRMAVMFIDLDGFKNVNDSLGHDIGDLLLQEVSVRLQNCLRIGDSIGRLGGDEFAIILEGLREPTDVTQVGERVLAAFVSPFVILEHQILTSASVGIAMYPHDGSDAGTLLKNADSAMYAAKRAGRNLFKFFSESADVA